MENKYFLFFVLFAYRINSLFEPVKYAPAKSMGSPFTPGAGYPNDTETWRIKLHSASPNNMSLSQRNNKCDVKLFSPISFLCSEFKYKT